MSVAKGAELMLHYAILAEMHAGILRSGNKKYENIHQFEQSSFEIYMKYKEYFIEKMVL